MSPTLDWNLCSCCVVLHLVADFSILSFVNRQWCGASGWLSTERDGSVSRRACHDVSASCVPRSALSITCFSRVPSGLTVYCVSAGVLQVITAFDTITVFFPVGHQSAPSVIVHLHHTCFWTSLRKSVTVIDIYKEILQSSFQYLVLYSCNHFRNKLYF